MGTTDANVVGGDAQAAAELKNRLRAEQIAALFQNVSLGVIGAACGAVILAGGLIALGATNSTRCILWVSYIFGCATGHLYLRRLYLRAQPDQDEWQVWAAWFSVISFLEGLGWGWAAIFLVGQSDNFSTEMLVLVVVVNIAGAAIPAFGAYLPAFFAFFLPTTLACVLWGVSSLNAFPEAAVMTMLMLLFTLAVSGLGVRNNQTIRELIDLRIRTNVLASDLRVQKELAEKASLAKSTFLAAASHDLRQPVHAIGLFVGALRGAALPPDAVRLVERIEESTIAMDGLFSGILDISKLDAGVVEVNPQTFAIQPVLDRICSDYGSEAQEKGITIAVHPGRSIVETDPILMERILRNLISNAVRHTNAGGRVVVGCRSRQDRLRVEIWDTGPGIPVLERERIFQEYFQLRNPERDRAMGLGLGLAIVRRLSDLLECPVELKSSPGRGSCFSVEIRKATAIGQNSGATALPAAPAAAFATGLVLVVDDEVAIRNAMQSLLTSWGYSVLTAGTGGEMKALLAQSGRRPDILICDYRLRGEENGIEVIRDLLTACDEAIPAMLITGDTAADRLLEARASGFLLLHKPVPNGKLRAAIFNLMAGSGAGLAMEAADADFRTKQGS